MLKRNLYFAPRSVKSKSSVLAILEYASNCWSPTSQKQVNSLNMVHHNAAKFASNFYPRKRNYDNFSISKILKYLHLDTLPKLEYQRLSRKCNKTKVGFHNQLVEPPCTIEAAQKTFFFQHLNCGMIVSLHDRQMHQATF